VAEFWRRWHISLTSWFRDYLYIPLGGSTGPKWKTVLNTSLVFLVSGLWHGANWTFVCWGILHALFFLPLLLSNRNRKNIGMVAAGKKGPTIKEALQIVFTFSLVCFAWIFFRADNMTQAFSYITHLFSPSLFSRPPVMPIVMLAILALFIWIEWMGREHAYAIAALGLKWPRPLRWAFYYMLIIAMFSIVSKTQQFIYFQF